MTVIFIGIFIVSFLWAWYSMRDFRMPKQIEQVLPKKKQGRIFFLKDKVEHYSSSESSSS